MQPELGPVFIGGLDASGKTPLRRILEASGILFWRRTYLWSHFDGRYGDLSSPAARTRCFDELRRHGAIRELGVDLADVERRLMEGPIGYARLFGLIGASAAAKAGRQRWGEQEAGVERRAADIFGSLPEARLLHLVRDPRDRHVVVARGRRRGPLLGVSIDQWQRDVAAAFANSASWPNRYKVVRFEDLATAPRETADEISRFIGEDATAVASAAERWAAENSDPRWRSGLYASRLSGRQLAFVEARAEADLERLHYPLLRRPLSRFDRLAYAATTLPLNTAAPPMLRALTAVVGSRSAGRMDKVRLDEATA